MSNEEYFKEDDIVLWETRQLGASAEHAIAVEMPSGLQKMLENLRNEPDNIKQLCEVGKELNPEVLQYLIDKQIEINKHLEPMMSTVSGCQQLVENFCLDTIKVDES